jgi:protein-disulfide isomerase
MPTDDRPTQLSLPLDFNRDHVLGSPGAPLQLIEYGDYECPDCLQLYPIIDQLRERFGVTMLFVFRHFPLFTVHRHASVAAQAAEAAGSQGKFWQMHDQLYRNQNRLETPDLTHYALRLGLDVYRFEHDLGAGTYLKRVESDFKSGQASGVKGTPTLFINGVRYQGEPTLEAMSEALRKVEIVSRG